MGQDRDEERTTEARIDRLRERVKEAQTWPQLRNTMLGILDLLADELLGEARK